MRGRSQSCPPGNSCLIGQIIDENCEMKARIAEPELVIPQSTGSQTPPTAGTKPKSTHLPCSAAVPAAQATSRTHRPNRGQQTSINPTATPRR